MPPTALISKFLTFTSGHGRTLTTDVRNILGCTEDECPNEMILEPVRIERIERGLALHDEDWLEWYDEADSAQDFITSWNSWTGWNDLDYTASQAYLWLYLAGAHRLACELFDKVYRPELKSEQSADYRYERFADGVDSARQEVCGAVYVYLERLGLEYNTTFLELWQGSDATLESGASLHDRSDGWE